MNAPLRKSRGLGAKMAQLHEGTKDHGMAGERKNGRSDHVVTDAMIDVMIAEMSGVVTICGTIRGEHGGIGKIKGAKRTAVVAEALIEDVKTEAIEAVEGNIEIHSQGLHSTTL